ncbi:bifunctional [glutamine synthetase] adenylyltransferase/[glutamine synthetase]-adenylyl-L-tyrosine phosphorylase [Sphingomonas gilva]|uniref:Bifunctional [glutamine synthetase] adenylyltransferase/[glutamine synthetase]-adenylyl-L-tyrosine phosphorylase n=1 Tax=Sphingomonas gilva TaxID=2305907 RepID=A0A396S3P7_9SPHN|nr:bifunctional [glutamine synthetase] adenylyltransferase/[glutamine synthetase]-adenylyl-L-tyrosine phosphorylase [Sphingomonas gilva]RHW18025.1 bifunctional [glutamine synthetase] adenylyltransferase/[glutamine synthetase]-adenylyl-L-tyrosine phosphorylase [Sphingomonas gilva]
MADALQRAERHAPFLANLIGREADLAAELAARGPDIAALLAPFEGEVARTLRVRRRRLALALAIGDLAGLLDFETVTQALSDFADAALDTAIRTAIAERYPDAEPSGFVAIALGKHGSRELNYSSDIDPIFLFDPQTLPRREREEPAEAAVRIGKRVVELLQARDGDGYVLRVDLRLRPSPEATPIALPIGAAIAYYESQALPWERAAFVRSRAAAGDIALGEHFLATVQPFIWRRALDFGAIGEIRGISRRIRAHHAQGQALGPGYDLKRGRGGIREVEFFTQIHQLIHGGREQGLRVPATLDALAALSAAGRIDGADAAALADAYRVHRTIEHRLQMVDDRQTHSLPEQAERIDNVARLHGIDDGAALIGLLRPHAERVGAIYDSLDEQAEPRLSGDADALETMLAGAGFEDPSAARARIESWRQGRAPALRSPAAQEALEAMLPRLLAALGAGPAPNAALNRLDDMLRRLPSAINFFRLIEARPALARLLGEVLAHAPTLADALGRRSELLDGLIDATALEGVGDVSQLAAEMQGPGDYQALLDHVRRTVNEKRFALGVQIVAGASDPLDVSAGYSRVAEAAIEVLASATVAEFVGAHGRVPDSELAIIALGRLGGGALTHASDLDLVYVFTGDHGATSDGAKPLGAVHYYNRLAQRVSGALSVPTAAGPLYEIDTRLRPSGAQGPLAVSLDAFALYQRESAWTWEHMALTRARPVFGSAAARGAIQAIIDEVLLQPRDNVRADAAEMRAEMMKHKPPRGDFDAKLLLGGLVDLEFAVHVTQLERLTGFDPDLARAIDALVAQDALPAAMRPAHDFLTRLLVTLRLVAPDAEAPPPATAALVARACGLADWDALVARLDATRQAVSACWHALQPENEDAAE